MDILGVKNLDKIALSRTVSEINVFFAEIQDCRQKHWVNKFWESWILVEIKKLKIFLKPGKQILGKVAILLFKFYVVFKTKLIMS